MTITRLYRCWLVGVFFSAVPATAALGADAFSYAGIGLDTTAAGVKPTFPNSRIVGNDVHVAERDSRDHIYGIRLAGGRKPRVVQISFERPQATAAGARFAYPTCKAVEAELRARYGAPDEVRKFVEGPSPRADRVWQSEREAMTLNCFQGEHGGLLAIGVVIAER